MLKVMVIDNDEVPLTWALDAIRDEGMEVVVQQCRTEGEVVAAAGDADVVVMVVAPITKRVLRSLERCRLVLKSGVGVDTVDLEAAQRLGIAVANVGNYCADEVAEHAFALAVALARKLPLGDREVRRGVWDRTQVIPVRRLASHKLGIIGLGAIGSSLAERWVALGGAVAYHDPYRQGSAVGKALEIDDLLGWADIISLHVPLTKETRHLVGRRELGLLRPGAYVVNTSRGEVIDSDALRDVVRTGRLGGVGIDVWDPEPMSMDDPLLSAPNVVVTPHYAGYSEESFDELRRRVVLQLVQVRDGELPTWTLNGVTELRVCV